MDEDDDEDKFFLFVLFHTNTSFLILYTNSFPSLSFIHNNTLSPHVQWIFPYLVRKAKMSG